MGAGSVKVGVDLDCVGRSQPLSPIKLTTPNIVRQKMFYSTVAASFINFLV